MGLRPKECRADRMMVDDLLLTLCHGGEGMALVLQGVYTGQHGSDGIRFGSHGTRLGVTAGSM